ncbi:MAG: efflux RND transporter periplasmic adaptor subunit [Gammaproteobacteria bacterium]|nr:efflux RND transporter periplasmic adaptor subunit [Gammaproteobacteria bacterium]
MKKSRKSIAKIVFPIVIIIAGVGTAWQLMANSPKVKRQSVEIQRPKVTTLTVTRQNIRIPIQTQGTVEPRTTIQLSAEVTGRITEAATQFVNGGFFNKGDVLLRIDTEEYKLAIIKAAATVAGAKQQLAAAEAEHKQKVKEYLGVSTDKISDYALRKPQYEEAKARLKAAKADLSLARLQLQRCDILAPFDGRVLKKQADIGQYVRPGVVLADIYAVDIAELRLPISQSQAQLIELPTLNQRQSTEEHAVTDVVIRGYYAGTEHRWEGRITRSDATIDTRNQLLYLIAQINDPYNMRIGAENNVPLTMGSFVTAEIMGRQLTDIIVIPRTAIHEQNTVWLLDESLSLQFHTVSIIYRGETHVYVNQGLQDGDRVITSPLDAAVDGMQLRIAEFPSMPPS